MKKLTHDDLDSIRNKLAQDVKTLPARTPHYLEGYYDALFDLFNGVKQHMGFMEEHEGDSPLPKR